MTLVSACILKTSFAESPKKEAEYYREVVINIFVSQGYCVKPFIKLQIVSLSLNNDIKKLI